jgi:hypothetical protein
VLNLQNKVGLPALLIAALREHPEDEELVKRVLQLVQTMAMDRIVAQEFERFAAIPVIHDVMDMHSTETDIPDFGQAAINAIMGWALKDAMDQKALEDAERARLLRQDRQEEERLWRLEAELAAHAEVAKKKADTAQLQREEEKRMQVELDKMRALQITKAEDEAMSLARIAAAQRFQAEEDSLRNARAERDRLAMEAREREEAERRRLAGAEAARLAAMAAKIKVENVQVKPKSVAPRKKFVDDDNDNYKREKHKRMKMDPDIKEFLWAGQSLQKHSNTAKPRARHLFMSADCKTLCWKAAGTKDLQPSQMMKIKSIASVDTGRCSKPLQRMSMFKKEYLVGTNPLGPTNPACPANPTDLACRTPPTDPISTTDPRNNNHTEPTDSTKTLLILPMLPTSPTDTAEPMNNARPRTRMSSSPSSAASPLPRRPRAWWWPRRKMKNAAWTSSAAPR